MGAVPDMISWRVAVGMCAATAGVFFLGVIAAHAWEGRANVEARSYFTLAGTLRGVAAGSTPSLRVTFHKPGAMDCAVVAEGVRYDAPSFSAQVPYDACGRGFFDGSNITFDLAVNDSAIQGPDGGYAINAVPYAQFANVAGAAGTPDCPVGYDRDVSDASIVLCRRCRGPGRFENCYDDVVRVGSGATAFWIDRYEASVWDVANAQFGVINDTYPNLPKNGQWYTASVTAPPLRAASRVGVSPSRFITWFQAIEVCSAAGKRLPSGSEWLLAAQGTSDPTVGNDGTDRDRRCNTLGPNVRYTGLGGASTASAGCYSVWGAQDMIGNVWEWTSDWYAGSGQVTSVPTFDHAMVVGSRINDQATPWSDEYRDDRTWNISSVASRSPLRGDDNRVGMPSADARGGSWRNGTQSGVFAVLLASGPSGWDDTVGFRCIVPR